MALRVINNFIEGSNNNKNKLIGNSYTQNLYLEKFDTEDIAGTSPYFLKSISGFSELFFEEEEFRDCRGLYVSKFNGMLISVWGNYVYVHYKSADGYSYRKLGAFISNTNDLVSIAESGGENPRILIADGFVLHSFLIKEINDITSSYIQVQLPKNADGEQIKPSYVSYQFGYLTINDRDTDRFYRSYLYPFEYEKNNEIEMRVFTYDPILEEEYENGMYIIADYSSDKIDAMCSNNEKLFVFGKNSVQEYVYTGDSRMPFSTTQSSKIGILNKDSLSIINNQMFWLGAGDEGQYGIFTASSVNDITRISTVNIEKEISSFDDVNCVAWTWTEAQHMFYAITFYKNNKTYVYDVTTQKWHNRVSTTENTNEDRFWRYRFARLFDNKICMSTEHGLTFIDNEKFTEHDGKRIVRLRRGGVTHDSFNYFMIDNVEFQISNGHVRLDNPTVRPKYMFRYSTDGVTFSNERISYGGLQGQYAYKTQFQRLGMGVIFIFEFSTSEDIDLVITSCKVNAVAMGRGF